MEKDLNMTQVVTDVENADKTVIKKTIMEVHEALLEKGYNPINQLIGYILSGDPTYITSHKNARNNICKFERDDILEEIFSNYIK